MRLADNILNENYVRPPKPADTGPPGGGPRAKAAGGGLGARPGSARGAAATPEVLSVQCTAYSEGWAPRRNFSWRRREGAAKRRLGSGEMETKPPSRVSPRPGPHRDPKLEQCCPVYPGGRARSPPVVRGLLSPKRLRNGVSGCHLKKGPTRKFCIPLD